MRKVEEMINIRTEPEIIISAFTEPEMLLDWWGVQRTLIDKRPGGVYTLAWNISDKGFGFLSTGFIKEYQPGKLLVVDNFVYCNPEKPFLGPMSLTIHARKKNDGISELFLCQDGYQQGPDWDWYYEVVKQAWPEVVNTLKEYLEKNKVITKSD
ncbi:SRPBCC family protein [Flavitalea sp.]|nr:SRPBCC domain-containing protein [Flavitalea sp.]